jgi:hypothetical protein
MIGHLRPAPKVDTVRLSNPPLNCDGPIQMAMPGLASPIHPLPFSGMAGLITLDPYGIQ